MGNNINSPIRVEIVSDSAAQRAALISILENRDLCIVKNTSLKEFNTTIDEPINADVLLVDLNDSDDSCLDEFFNFADNSETPILFNDGVIAPTTDGPIKDEWTTKLVNKLTDLAKDNQKTRNPLRVTIIGKSKTRRRALNTLLNSFGLANTSERDFSEISLNDLVDSSDVLLIDQHNVGHTELTTFKLLYGQTQIPRHICNSSQIPIDIQDRNEWGLALTDQLVKLQKSTSTQESEPASKQNSQNTSPPNQESSNINTEKHQSSQNDDWANKLVVTLEGVREEWKSSSSSPAKSTVANNTGTVAKKKHLNAVESTKSETNNSYQIRNKNSLDNNESKIVKPKIVQLTDDVDPSAGERKTKNQPIQNMKADRTLSQQDHSQLRVPTTEFSNTEIHDNNVSTQAFQKASLKNKVNNISSDQNKNRDLPAEVQKQLELRKMLPATETAKTTFPRRDYSEIQEGGIISLKGEADIFGMYFNKGKDEKSEPQFSLPTAFQKELQSLENDLDIFLEADDSLFEDDPSIPIIEDIVEEWSNPFDSEFSYGEQSKSKPGLLTRWFRNFSR